MPPRHTDEGIDAAIRLRERFPGLGVLVLSTFLGKVTVTPSRTENHDPLSQRVRGSSPTAHPLWPGLSPGRFRDSALTQSSCESDCRRSAKEVAVAPVVAWRLRLP